MGERSLKISEYRKRFPWGSEFFNMDDARYRLKEEGFKLVPNTGGKVLEHPIRRVRAYLNMVFKDKEAQEFFRRYEGCHVSYVALDVKKERR